MYGQYLPTILIDDDTQEGLLTGSVELKPGQWCSFGSTKVRFVGVRHEKSGRNAIHYCYRKGDAAIQWSKRMGRARWHLAYKHSPDTILRITPSLMAKDVVKAVEHYNFNVNKKPVTVREKVKTAISLFRK